MPAPEFNQPLVPSLDVIINGTPLKATDLAYVINVIADTAVDMPGMFAIELSGADTLGELLPWVDDSRFNIGQAVEIKFGYGDKMEKLIAGEITGLEPEFAFDRLPSLTVRGYDRLHRLQRGRKTRTFVKQKDSVIASQLAREAGLTVQATDSKVTHDYIAQVNQTNWEFLLERARRIGYEILVEDKKMLFRPVANAQSAVLTLSFDKTLLEFYPRLISPGQVDDVSVRGWSVKDKKEIAGKAKTGDEVSKMGGQQSGGALAKKAFGAAPDLMDASPVMTQAEADQMAKARLNHAAIGLITGEGVCYGRTDLQAGKVVKFEGIGKRFGGLYYVTNAVHSYTTRNGYLTRFTVRRNAS